MFCYQCEQTDKGTGCTIVGNCGKTDVVSREQDLFIHSLKGIAQIQDRITQLGGKVGKHEQDFLIDGIFSTVTNVNFDSKRFLDYLSEANNIILRQTESYEDLCKKNGLKVDNLKDSPTASWRLEEPTEDGVVEQAKSLGDILDKKALLGEDKVGLQEMIMYGIKGSVAYFDHVRRLGNDEIEIYNELQGLLRKLAESNDYSIDQLLGLALEVGQTNLKVMEKLSSAHSNSFGSPVPTEVSTAVKKGPAILISGHDLVDLEALLKQSEGKGVNIYTHGEMLPAHGYPGLKKYKHLAGNYGGPWQLQQIEFAQFKGPILLTSNCLIEPRKSYKDRVFTTNSVGFSGVKHVTGKDYTEIIDMAIKMGGFPADKGNEAEKLLVGFGHDAVLGVADKVVDAIKQQKLSHFFLIGGCDGAEAERNYFTNLAKAVPDDGIVLTLGCGKYRFNKRQKEMGDIGGIPRLLDMGQCNDAYSAVRVALALKDAFKLDSVNDLPLSLAVSWFEQKAVAVLLTLLSLNVKRIRLGPKLPGFATKNIVKVLQDKFDLKVIGNPEQDVKLMLNKQ